MIANMSVWIIGAAVVSISFLLGYIYGKAEKP